MSGQKKRGGERVLDERDSKPKAILPYGSWPTELSADRLLEGALRLGRPQLDQGWIYWIEGRPSEGGRQVVLRARPGTAPSDVTPADQNVRTLVHEYGGGDYRVRDGRIVYAEMAEQRVWICEVGRPDSARLLAAGGPRYADFAWSPDCRWVAAVEERARAQGEPENRIVAFRVDEGDGLVEPIVVAEGHDFVSFPRFSPDGSRLVYTAWDHPNMPWDGTRLFEQRFAEGGPEGEAVLVAGGPDESIFQPGFSPDGVLTFVSDRSGWWNLMRVEDGLLREVCPAEAEFGRAQWVFDMSTWAYVSAEEILCSVTRQGVDSLARLDVATGALRDVDQPCSNAVGLEVEGDIACFVGGGPDRATAIWRLDLAEESLAEVRPSFTFVLDAVSRPEPIEFDTSDGRRAHAFFYPPTNAHAEGPEGELPPLLVKSHGGPTAATVPVLSLAIQYWTSRGFAVVDVNYGGSSGYGRAYRERLRERWGVVDVDDCVNAARSLAGQGRVDPDRLAISGGSAGGYTTLCALTFHDVFRAGASHYGIGDLEALARDTHKFEARYLDSLVGPYPATRERYRERSPIHFTEQLSCPVIFFQGLEDKVVPPSQAEAMVEALAKRGVAHAHVTFPGEQHGFRRAENIRTALEGELYFYGRIFGFETDVQPEGVEILG
jgi:dipeptidyl aminopeptidase/acylaminoacyl peptidase